MHEVRLSLVLACLLVLAIIFVFLGSVRAALIPAVTVPISLVSAFIVLYALGFSVNLLTLLALVLSIGILVDDSIIVLENIHRRIEDGEPPLLAAYRGASEVAFAVIASTLVLMAVFVPISLMRGDTGRLFTEFALRHGGGRRLLGRGRAHALTDDVLEDAPATGRRGSVHEDGRRDVQARHRGIRACSASMRALPRSVSLRP